MTKRKERVTISNNMISIGNKKFIFDQNNLLILKETNDQSYISILKLYSPYATHTNLTKYHFSTNHAIFFFIYRNEDAKECGMHFYLIIKYEELFSMIKQNEWLINEGTKIFNMKTIDSIEPLSFNHDQIKKYCIEDKKHYFRLRNKLVFELTRDFADPTLDYFPFLFYQKVAFNKFEIFFCFINVEAAGEYLIQNKKADEI